MATLAMPGRRPGYRRVAAVLAATALLATACGDDEDTADTSGASSPSTTATDDATTTFPATSSAPTEGSSPSTSEATGTTDVATPSGEPIKVMTIGGFTNATFGVDFTEQPAAVEAHIAALNASGGIDGRPVESIVCDTEIDPAKFLDCTRTAVDESVAAIIGLGAAGDSTDAFALLERAEIPVIGPIAADNATLTSALSFPLVSGAIGQVFAIPSAFSTIGVEKASFVGPDIGGGSAMAQIEGIWGAGLAQAGVEDGGFVLVPPDATDLSPVVGTATSGGTGGVASYLLGEANARLIQALRQQAPDVDLVINGNQITSDFLDSLDGAGDGAVAVNYFPPTTATGIAGIDRLVDEITRYDDELMITDESINYWLAAYIFGEVAAELAASGGTIDGPGMLAALDEASDIDTLGLTAPLDFTTPFTGVPGLDRLFNPASVLTQIRDGEQFLLDAASPFTNPFGG